MSSPNKLNTNSITNLQGVQQSIGAGSGSQMQSPLNNNSQSVLQQSNLQSLTSNKDQNVLNSKQFTHTTMRQFGNQHFQQLPEHEGKEVTWYSFEQKMRKNIHDMIEPVQEKNKQNFDYLNQMKKNFQIFDTKFNDFKEDHNRLISQLQDYRMLEQMLKNNEDKLYQSENVLRNMCKDTNNRVENWGRQFKMMDAQVNNITRKFDERKDDYKKYNDMMDSYKDQIENKFFQITEHMLSEMNSKTLKSEEVQQQLDKFQVTCNAVNQYVKDLDVRLVKTDQSVICLRHDIEQNKFSAMLGERIDKQGQQMRQDVSNINQRIKELRESTQNHIDEKKIQNTIYQMQTNMMSSIFKKKKGDNEFDDITYLRLNYIKYKADIIDLIKQAEIMEFPEITHNRIQLMSQGVKLQVKTKKLQQQVTELDDRHSIHLDGTNEQTKELKEKLNLTSFTIMKEQENQENQKPQLHVNMLRKIKNAMRINVVKKKKDFYEVENKNENEKIVYLRVVPRRKSCFELDEKPAITQLCETPRELKSPFSNYNNMQPQPGSGIGMNHNSMALQRMQTSGRGQSSNSLMNNVQQNQSKISSSVSSSLRLGMLDMINKKQQQMQEEAMKNRISMNQDALNMMQPPEMNIQMPQLNLPQSPMQLLLSNPTLSKQDETSRSKEDESESGSDSSESESNSESDSKKLGKKLEYYRQQSTRRSKKSGPIIENIQEKSVSSEMESDNEAFKDTDTEEIKVIKKKKKKVRKVIQVVSASEQSNQEQSSGDEETKSPTTLKVPKKVQKVRSKKSDQEATQGGGGGLSNQNFRIIEKIQKSLKQLEEGHSKLSKDMKENKGHISDLKNNSTKNQEASSKLQADKLAMEKQIDEKNRRLTINQKQTAQQTQQLAKLLDQLNQMQSQIDANSDKLKNSLKEHKQLKYLVEQNKIEYEDQRKVDHKHFEKKFHPKFDITDYNTKKKAMEKYEKDKKKHNKEIQAEIHQELYTLNSQLTGQIQQIRMEYYKMVQDLQQNVNSQINELKTKDIGDLVKSTTAQTEELTKMTTENVQKVELQMKNQNEHMGNLSDQLKEDMSQMLRKLQREKADTKVSFKAAADDRKLIRQSIQRFKDDFKSHSEILATLVELEFISQSLDFQDEHDKSSMHLWGIEHDAKKVLKNQSSNPIQIDEDCLACAPEKYRPTISTAFKIACIMYKPSKVIFRGGAFDRLKLIECKRSMIDKEWNKILRTEPFEELYGRDEPEICFYKEFSKKLKAFISEQHLADDIMKTDFGREVKLPDNSALIYVNSTRNNGQQLNETKTKFDETIQQQSMAPSVNAKLIKDQHMNEMSSSIIAKQKEHKDQLNITQDYDSINDELFNHSIDKDNMHDFVNQLNGHNAAKQSGQRLFPFQNQQHLGNAHMMLNNEEQHMQTSRKKLQSSLLKDDLRSPYSPKHKDPLVHASVEDFDYHRSNKLLHPTGIALVNKQVQEKNHTYFMPAISQAGNNTYQTQKGLESVHSLKSTRINGLSSKEQKSVIKKLQHQQSLFRNNANHTSGAKIGNSSVGRLKIDLNNTHMASGVSNMFNLAMPNEPSFPITTTTMQGKARLNQIQQAQADQSQSHERSIIKEKLKNLTRNHGFKSTASQNVGDSVNSTIHARKSRAPTKSPPTLSSSMNKDLPLS